MPIKLLTSCNKEQQVPQKNPRVNSNNTLTFTLHRFSSDPLMNSDNTITTIASENIRDLWKVLDNTPGKGPSAASNVHILHLIIDVFHP